jgi:hypothetical protein
VSFILAGTMKKKGKHSYGSRGKDKILCWGEQKGERKRSREGKKAKID